MAGEHISHCFKTVVISSRQYNPEKNIIEKSKNIKMSASKQQAEQTYYKSIKAIIVGDDMTTKNAMFCVDCCLLDFTLCNRF